MRRLVRHAIPRPPAPAPAPAPVPVPAPKPAAEKPAQVKAPKPVKRPPFDDHRFQRELATSPLFTAATTGPLREADQAATGELTTRTIELQSLQVRLTLPEAESIHGHGIVRLRSDRIAGAGDPPPDTVAFVVVVNDKYAPGLEALALSLVRQYPSFGCDIVVVHDDSLSPFSRSRLNGIYPHFRFLACSTERYDVGQIGGSVNHRRVGLLGYLSLEALALAEYERVIVIDADTIVLNDISRLWTGDRIQVVADHGVLPFGLVATSLGRPVINSGLISLPASELGEQAHGRALDVLPGVLELADPLLDSFADQKFWNLYLAGKDVEFLPVNYNTNKNLIDRYFPDLLASTAVLHLTGAKPWYDFSDQDLVTDDDRARLGKGKAASRSTFGLWNQSYVSAVTTVRRRGFATDCGPGLERLRGTRPDRPAVLIGNGPSLRETDLSRFEGYEKLTFNWFVHHQDFDAVRPDHLVLASHMFFGGWHTTRPAFPAGFLSALTGHRHRPRIWTSYYFRDLIEHTPELVSYNVSYFLFEKPLRTSLSRLGTVELDLLQPLIDASTGVLTAGVPIALHLGATTLVLTGCDADYGSAAGSYFYPADAHTSRTTESGQLIGTWSDSGAGQFGYQRVAEELTARGGRLLDATVGGRLTVLPKLTVAEVTALAADHRIELTTASPGGGVAAAPGVGD